MKVFVDTDSDVRLSRRLNRDISQRGRDIKGVLEQYERHVKPAFDYYITPTMNNKRRLQDNSISSSCFRLMPTSLCQEAARTK